MKGSRATASPGDMGNVASGKSAIPKPPAWLPSAPEVLRKFYERNRKGQAAAVLDRLLSDARMKAPWRVLDRVVKDDREWLALWAAIRAARSYSRRVSRVRTRAQEQKKFNEVEIRARKLATLIRGQELDLLAYELFPSEVMEALGILNWADLDPVDRDVAANKLLTHWPEASELLDGLAHQASLRAHNAKLSPRLVERTTRDAPAIVFVRVLALHFSRVYGKPMYGTLAAITQVVLQRDLSKAFVTNTIKRKPRRLDFSLPV